MNPIILPSSMGKLLGRVGSSALVSQPNKKENSELKSAKLCLKIDLLSHSALRRGWIDR